LLVTSLESFERYQREHAWTWEHQALVRARIVAGNAELAKRFQSVRKSLLLLERDAEKLKRDVREMRARMHHELGTNNDAQFDIKQDRGGIADIEFMVQYGALAWAPKLRKYLHFTDNLRLLEAMAEHKLMDAADAALLVGAYRDYRAHVHRLTLEEKAAVVASAQFKRLRAQVGAVWRRLMESTVS
jgi:glutamate-ammonia-ligase adenylyltransferase